MKPMLTVHYIDETEKSFNVVGGWRFNMYDLEINDVSTNSKTFIPNCIIKRIVVEISY